MELILVLVLIVIWLVFAVGGAIWIWIGVLIVASLVGRRAYRVRCKKCGKQAMAGRRMKFCGQCGFRQTSSGLFRFRCESCRRLARSELNMNFCNLCGAAVKMEEAETA